MTNPPDLNHEWSDDIEEVLESIRHNAFVMSGHHKSLYLSFKDQLKYYKIPVIIISGFNSVTAVGLQPYMPQHIISGLTCVLALVCGMIGSIELFLGIQASMETELNASKNFYLLAINIYKTLTLDRERRPIPGQDYLDDVYTEYTKYFENSALLNKRDISDKLFGTIDHNQPPRPPGSSPTPMLPHARLPDPAMGVAPKVERFRKPTRGVVPNLAMIQEQVSEVSAVSEARVEGSVDHEIEMILDV